MSFMKKYCPQHINDLVFAEPSIQQVIREYAAGTRSDHLLLAGPTGAGKSIAAQMIWRSRSAGTRCSTLSPVYQGQGLGAEEFEKIEGDWNIQVPDGFAYSIIDEIDQASRSARNTVRNFMATAPYATFICTTNYPENLEVPFVKRFCVVEMAPPKPNQWVERAFEIFQAEGHQLTQSQVEDTLVNFNGDARDFIRMVEGACIKLAVRRNALGWQPQVFIK